MFEQLDDPESFHPTEAFRAKVDARARLLRRRRRTQRIAVGCGAAASLSVVVALRRSEGGESTQIIVAGNTDHASTQVEVTSTPDTSALTTDAPATPMSAKNFLVVGSDGRDCIDPDSPYAGAFLGEGVDGGSRSDTLMMIRVDPDGQTALLSFPRDLWVSIAGTNRKSRINAAFDPTNAKTLIDTIQLNFELPIDHYISVDFCGFKDIVDAIGGVAVPFEFATRDKNTGLDIAGAECHTFDGDEALAYVRSRKYEYYDPGSNRWVADDTGDFGRITRQQDFVKRTIAKVLDAIRSNPLAANDLIDATVQNLITDRNLTVDTMLQLAEAMSGTDASTISQFQIEGRGVLKGNASVTEPMLDTPGMRQVLAIFRGDAQVAEPAATDPAGDEATQASTGPGSLVELADTAKGIFPPADPTCR